MGISIMISVSKKADVRSETGRITRPCDTAVYSLLPIMKGLEYCCKPILANYGIFKAN